MTTLANMLAAAQRLLTYYNGDEKTAQNPGGLTGVGGMADNWDPCIQDIGTVANGVGAAMTAASTSEGNAAASATAAAGSAQSAQQHAQATAADRQATGQNQQATAADRLAVAQDKTAVHQDRLAADADAQATAADRQAVAQDKATVHQDRLAADAAAQATAQDRQATQADRQQTGLDRQAAQQAAANAQTWDPTNYVPKSSTDSASTPNSIAKRRADSGLAATTFYAEGPVPNFHLYETDGPANSKRWGMFAEAGLLTWNLVDDTWTSGVPWLTVSRSGMSVGAIDFKAAITVNGQPVAGGEDTATSIAAAATVNLGNTTAKAIKITAGTGPIAAWGTAPAGAHRDITFATAVTLTHNSTSAILVGGGNITTVAGDTCRMESLGSGNWKMLSYQRASGYPLGTATSQSLSPSDKSSNATLSNVNTTVVTADGGIASGRGVAAMTTPVYWEVVVNAIGTNVTPGIASAAAPLTDYITNSATGYGYLSSGLKANNASAAGFGASYAAGDRLCFAYNPASRNFWMGKVVGGAAVWGASGDPAAGTNPAYTTPVSTPMYPAYSVNGSGSSLTFAFGSGQQVATPPSGFAAFG